MRAGPKAEPKKTMKGEGGTLTPIPRVEKNPFSPGRKPAKRRACLFDFYREGALRLDRRDESKRWEENGLDLRPKRSFQDEISRGL